MTMSPDDPIPLEENAGPAERTAEVIAEVLEDLAVERLGPRIGQNDRRPVRPPPRTTGPLEVVGPAGGNVAHEHGTQAADVDPEFQRRRRAEDVSEPHFEQVLQ